MGHWRLAVMAAIAFFASSAPSLGEGLEVQPVIGGKSMQCEDFRGVPVRTLQIKELGDVGSARIIGRIPVILLDEDRLAGLPARLQLFFYGHECAHHVLGHSFTQTIWSEREADCWAIKLGRDKGFFSREDVVEWAPYFAHSKGSALGHLPGPQRASRLVACFDDPSDELVEPLEARNHDAVRSASTGG